MCVYFYSSPLRQGICVFAGENSRSIIFPELLSVELAAGQPGRAQFYPQLDFDFILYTQQYVVETKISSMRSK